LNGGICEINDSPSLIFEDTSKWNSIVQQAQKLLQRETRLLSTAIALVIRPCMRTGATLFDFEISPALGRSLDYVTDLLPMIICMTKSFSIIIWEFSGCSRAYNMNFNISIKIL